MYISGELGWVRGKAYFFHETMISKFCVLVYKTGYYRYFLLHMYLLLYLQLLNIQVPIFFKHIVDHYNALPSIVTPESTVITMGGALILGCKSCIYAVKPSIVDSLR